jgi:WD40 repeat protein
MRAVAALTLLAALAVSSVAPTQEPKKDPKDLPPIPTIALKRTEPVEYSRDIEPIFENKCTVCHSGSIVEAKFDMSTHAGVLKGGKRGPAVVPGKSAESNLFLFCSRQKKPHMPPPKTDEPLTSQELSVIKLWIDEGAKAPTMARERVKVVVNLPPAIVKPVRAVAVSPDGKTVAASRGNQVHLYDGKKGEYLKSLADPDLKTPDGTPAKAAHISLVESMAFSPDGKTLATGSFQELTLWDVESAEPKQRITGFADRVVAVTYAPNGKHLATGGGAPTEDGEIKILDAETGKVLHDIRNGHSDTVFGVAFSPDGRLLATASADRFVKVFELPHPGYGWPFPPGPEAPRLVRAFEGHTHHVMDVGWTPDGKRLVSCGADNFVKVWNYETGEKVRDMQGHQKQVTRLAFVGKTPQFVTASGDAQVRMWNADNGGNVRQFPGAGDFLYAVSVSTDGEVVAAGGEDGVVRVYNGKNGQLIKAALPPGAEPKK